MTRAISAAEKTRWVCEQARDTGFDLCGVAPVALENAEAGGSANGSGTLNSSTAGSFPELAHLPEWLARGYAGGMNYLRDPRRADPRRALDGARSLIVVALNYNSAPAYSTARGATFSPAVPAKSAEVVGSGEESPRGWISRYAWGDDYHSVLREKLDQLLTAMRAEFPEPFEARAYVDTGPVIERVAAKYAGLGWLAKNTCLINQQLGSWLFLGVIISTLALEPTLAAGEPPAPDLCGTCTRCLDACPTQAFPAPYVLDSRRCISYLTIELRDAIPEEFRPAMGSAVIGCDICQDVCPWNRKAPVTRLAAFAPREISRMPNSPPAMPDERGASEGSSRSLLAPELEWLASLSQSEFSEIFRRSAMKRAKWRGLVRNACVALGNSGIACDSASYRRVSGLLERLASSDDSFISEHARWALSRLRTSREREDSERTGRNAVSG